MQFWYNNIVLCKRTKTWDNFNLNWTFIGCKFQCSEIFKNVTWAAPLKYFSYSCLMELNSLRQHWQFCLSNLCVASHCNLKYVPGAKNTKYMMRPISGIHAKGVGQKSYAQVKMPEIKKNKRFILSIASNYIIQSKIV